MASLNYLIIQTAYQNGDQIECDYQGFHRVFSPHALKFKWGVEKCLGYQYGGTSAKPLGGVGSALNWRCFRVSLMLNVIPVVGAVHTASDHSRPQNCTE